MKRRVAFLVLLCAGLATTNRGPAFDSNPDAARWERRAQNVVIVRDDWGIPHVSGKSDADAVFGLIYAQAEDDFNRIETNYLNALGRLAEAEGESAISRDLRMKWYGTSGNSFVAVVEFGGRVRAKAISVGGVSGNPSSPHFNDQAERYAKGELREVYFYRQELEGHIARRYRPGQ